MDTVGVVAAMNSNARDRIAERVKNAYAAGYNDGRKGRDRMDEVAETETGKILEVVRELLLSPEPLEAAADIWNHHHAPTCDRAITAALDAAFGTEQE